jgi:D-glycero-beta-D-manno-heptose-7-phosphate kinase
MSEPITISRIERIIGGFKDKTIIVVGDVMVDEFIWGKVARISPEAPVPVVEVSHETYRLGGAANVTSNIRALEGRPVTLGVIGVDRAADRLLELFDQSGIDAWGLQRDDRPTTLKTRIVAHNQQVVRTDRESRKPLATTINDALASAFTQRLSSAHAVIISDYDKGVINRELLSLLLPRARTAGVPVFLDPKVDHADYYTPITVITPNQREAELLTGLAIRDDRSLEDAGQRLINKFECEYALITRGEEGMSLFNTFGSHHMPTFAREVFDVTGAGDTVIATLALARAGGATMEEAALLANHAAGIVVGKIGTATVSGSELLSDFLQVSSARNLGGGETHVIELTETLRSLGHNVSIAGRADGPLHPDIRLPFLNSADIYSALRLRSLFKRQQFDVVHAHVARDYSVVTAAAWGVPRLKVIFTRHLLYPVRGHCFYRRVDGWMAPTAQIMKTLGPLSSKMSAVIPNWVDVKKFAFRPHAIHRPVTIGLLGQISPHKGHDDAIEALRELGSGYSLFIAGKGETSYVAGLKAKAAGLPVEFPGFVSLPDFFEKVDMLAVPSWEEPFGIVLLEAMASGVPVIATNRGGPPEIIRSKLHGSLVPPRDSHALAAAIRELAQDDTHRQSIATHARAHVEKTYDILKVVPRIEAFYQRAILGKTD